MIPAHPLALTSSRELDRSRQKALTRYYLDAGAGGIAVGVHSTQFEIRGPEFDLFEPVLKLAIETVNRWSPERPLLNIAGVIGPTDQALSEAELAAELGYDMVLLSNAVEGYSEEELLDRARSVSEVLPVFGFYLQPAVGGRELSFDFWRSFAEIPEVQAIKIAPFDRYRTLDVVRAVCESSRREEIALYTGNDDTIVTDLLTPFELTVDGDPVQKYIVGGLLGQWGFWTRKAVELLDRIKEVRHQERIPSDLLKIGAQITDVNAAVFDPAHEFAGCLPGIHEMLRRQGLLEGRWCLDPEETLSPGQLEEIQRVSDDYPHLNDDEFVAGNLERWTEKA